MLEDLPDLLRTELHLLKLAGEVEVHSDYIVGRSPSNPGYYHGNFLFLRAPPTTLRPWLERFESAFGPEVKHRCLSWVGPEPTAAVVAEAEVLGLLPDSGVGLALEAAPAIPPPPDVRGDGAWTVRPLEAGLEWERFEVLNRECDPAEAQGLATYRLFKERLRATIRKWWEMGAATWWGGFLGDRLVAQCGFVRCDHLGRFQAVETHPAFRRRGLCSTLVATVAQAGFADPECRRMLLEADNTGPAIALYRRLGFVPDTVVHSLVRPCESLQVRAESGGEEADVRSLLHAAFETTAEAELVETLRSLPGVISLVAVQSGAVVGHALFSPVRIEGSGGRWSAMALGPIAVRPSRQGRGVGTQLMEVGLEACRSAGHEVCFVLGHPSYYPRVGFRPAPPLGLTCKWPVPEDVFMVAEMTPGALAGRRGRVSYHAAFDNATG